MSIISKASLEKLENVRKYVLKTAIWLLVGGVVLGAMTILFGGSSSGEIIGKFMGTLFIVALMMIVSVNNFKMIASEDAKIQSFALVGLVSNLAWALFWTLLCWVPEWGTTCNSSCVTCTNCGASMLIKSAAAFSYLSALGLIGSNVLSIYEGDKKSLIRPLKITAVICATYEFLYLAVLTFSGYDFTSEFAARLGMLAIFAGFAWFAIVIAALILSSSEKNRKKKDTSISVNKSKKDEDDDAPKAKSDAELRAEIEEQVRREMIEKEVRARMEAEQNAQKKNSDSADEE